MAAVCEDDPAMCVFVGDRPFDDVHGAKSIGMRAVLMQNADVPPFAAAVPDADPATLKRPEAAARELADTIAAALPPRNVSVAYSHAGAVKEGGVP